MTASNVSFKANNQCFSIIQRLEFPKDATNKKEKLSLGTLPVLLEA